MPNILICDDDRTARFLLKRILVRELDANVTEAPDGLQAIRLLSGAPYDLLILDLRMPVMDGAETLEIVRNTPALRDLPVIVLSGETDAEVVRRVVQAGVTDFLLKPLVRPGTQQRLMQIIDRFRRRDPAPGAVPAADGAANDLAVGGEAMGSATTPFARLIARVPDLRGAVISATEQMFGMIVKMDVELLPGTAAPFALPYLAGRLQLIVADEFDVEIELSCTAQSANVFAVAMPGAAQPAEALAELATIVAGRVRKEIISGGLSATLGAPEITTIQTNEPGPRPAHLATRFGVIDTPHQLEVSLRVDDRAGTNPI